jgi:hypothetical protein
MMKRTDQESQQPVLFLLHHKRSTVGRLQFVESHVERKLESLKKWFPSTRGSDSLAFDERFESSCAMGQTFMEAFVTTVLQTKDMKNL